MIEVVTRDANGGCSRVYLRPANRFYVGTQNELVVYYREDAGRPLEYEIMSIGDHRLRAPTNAMPVSNATVFASGTWVRAEYRYETAIETEGVQEA